jgi:CSLREA domain-containing protein
MTMPPAIAASKTAQPAFYPNAVAPGEEMTYTISLTWNGAGDAASTMSDAIPPYSDYVPGTAHATLGSVGYVGGADDGSISWTGTIPSGQTAIITFRVKVDMSELPVSRLAWPTAINNSASGQIGASSFSVARSVYLFNPTVNTTADTVAGDPHDGICGQDAVPCSLREALEEVNYHPNVGTSVDTISFNIPVGSMAAAAPNASPVISVTSVLPTVAEAVILDGTTQAGGKPEINGSGTPAGTHGLNIAANGSVVQGLAVKGFSGHGVLLNGSQNTIGGTAAAAGNVIANNGQKGVVVASGTRNSILGNAIYGNGVFAIDLGNDGLTLNDLLDADSGANNLQNFPLVLGVQGTVITGSLNSAPTTAYRIELFSASTCVAGGSGQAEQYLGAVTVNTGSVGEATFTFNAAQAIPQGWQVSATATDQNGNTSELTPCPEALVFKVDNAGNVYADGAYQLLTADFAESWDLTPGPSPTGRGEAEVRSPEPGDVLALGPDGGVVLAGLPGAGAVIGVYASQPGLLAGDTEADGESNTQKPRVPVAMMGIVAVKVSADNGPIHPGDLLGLSATPGVAARARPISFGGQEFYLWGTFFGKALEGFDGTDVGMIRILLKRR